MTVPVKEVALVEARNQLVKAIRAELGVSSRMSEIDHAIAALDIAITKSRAAQALAGQEEAPHLDEEVPHPFNSRTPYEPEDERDIWCKDCEHHRDARIHASAKAEEHAPAPPRPKPDIAALKALPDEF
jgi:hypothetical protein